MKALAENFDSIGFIIDEYNSKNRTYRPEIKGLDVRVRAKIMAEKDAAIQVAVGNYDIGFCGLDWLKEHTIKYKSADLYLFGNMGLDKKALYACTGLNGAFQAKEDLYKNQDFLTIVSEYSNIAEDFAISNKLKKFKIFSAWGSVEAYPPEHADVVILSSYDKNALNVSGLQIIDCVLESDLCMVVNRKSFIKKDLAPVLRFFSDMEIKNAD
ncbi:ATP phosphoribosyltransferase [Candidatus Magnetomoraceae bacterium gMMP-1]